MEILNEAGQSPQPHLQCLPELLLEEIARFVHCTANRHATANLHAFATTCSAIAHAALPILYERLEIHNLPALPLLSHTLRTCPHHAKQVRVISLGEIFLDFSQVDIKFALGSENKTTEPVAFPNEFRCRFFGQDTSRSLVMMWLAYLADQCPSLAGVSLENMTECPPYLAHGFANLAVVLRKRKAWFKSPPRGIFPLAAVRVNAPPSGNPRSARHKTFPMLVTAVDYGRKQMDLNSNVDINAFPEFNLQSINTLIPGGKEEHGSWWIRTMSVRDLSDCGMSEKWQSLPEEQLSGCLALHADDHVFDLGKQRMPLPPPLPPTSISVPQPTSTTNSKPAPKRLVPKPRKSATKSSATSTNPVAAAAAGAAASPQALTAKFAGDLNLVAGHLQAAYSVLKRYGVTESQCARLHLVFPITADQLGAYATQFPALINKQVGFSLSALALARANPWINVSTLTLGSPLFTTPASTRSFNLLAQFAQGFPNVTSLTVQIADVTSVMDALVAVDPFVRRTREFGKPLKVLKILRSTSMNGVAQWADLPPRYSPPPRTQLSMTGPCPGHLQELAIDDRAKWTSRTETENLIMIHPGLLHSLTHIAVRAARLVIAPPRLAKPNSPSFPSVRQLKANERPLFLSYTTLPKLNTLHIDAKGELANMDIELTDRTFANALPACPNLETLVADVPMHTAGSLVTIAAKYPRLRNLALAFLAAPRGALELIADALFAHPIRAMRPAPLLSRVLVVSTPDDVSIQVEREAYLDHPHVGVFVLGPEVGSVFLSDVLVPEELDARLVPAMPGFPVREQYVPRIDEGCLCGRGAMGEDFDEMEESEDAVPDVWIHPMVGKVVCRVCCTWVAEKIVTKHGVVVRKLEQASGLMAFMEFMSEGVWRMCFL